jgi:hypothetical protein
MFNWKRRFILVVRIFFRGGNYTVNLHILHLSRRVLNAGDRWTICSKINESAALGRRGFNWTTAGSNLYLGSSHAHPSKKDSQGRSNAAY